MVVVVQLVRTSDCGSEGRGFEPHLPPGLKGSLRFQRAFFHCNWGGFRLFLLKHMYIFVINKANQLLQMQVVIQIIDLKRETY
jgi:hypothetical protein